MSEPIPPCNIVEDPEIMGGVPCFAGTRLPVATVIALKVAGLEFEAIRNGYPFLTEKLVAEAVAYVKTHPQRDRPRCISEANPAWPLASSKVVRPASSNG